MTKFVFIAFSVLATLGLATVASAQHRSYAGDISRVTLPLTAKGEAKLVKLEKQIKDCRKNASDDLVRINCHADAVQVNVIQALHALKKVQDREASGFIAEGKVAANLGQATKAGGQVFHMYFRSSEQRYVFVWDNIKPAYERIADAYRAQGYDLARAKVKGLSRAFEEFNAMLNRS